MLKINFPQVNLSHFSFNKKSYFSILGVVASVFLLLLGSLPLRAEELLYKTSYVCYDSEDKERWRATTEIVPFEGEGIYKLIEKGTGFYSGFEGRISWFSEMIFESDEKTIKPIRMEKEVFNAEGEKVAFITQDFDFSTRKIRHTYNDLIDDSKTEKVFRIKGDTINRLTLGLYIQNFLENGKRKKAVYLLSSEPALYRFIIKVVKTEPIEVNGEEKEAFKLYLNPDIGLLGVFKGLIPKAYVWHSSSPRYEWYKYTGLERGIDSPKIRIETLD